MVGFVRLIQLAKMVTTVAAGWTVFVFFSIVGWQAWTWAAEGSWPTLLLSDVMDRFRSADGPVYVTASVEESEKSSTSYLFDAILSIPATVPLLVASAMIIGFYLWLRKIEHDLICDSP